jgi:predicted CoA-substrate-specific enzyme activase
MSKVYVGIDIGSISSKVVVFDDRGNLLFKDYKRTFGRPVETVKAQLKGLKHFEITDLTATGSGARLLGQQIPDFQIHVINEFKAFVTAVGKLYPDVRTIFEMGGESSKFIRVENGQIIEYGKSGDCAAGTGSFIDQQAERLHYKVEDIGGLVKCSSRCARVAGRCSVFAKSDMIHAQQKGYTPPEVLKGLCLAVTRNFKATIVKGRHVVPKIAFVGGLALNEGVVSALKETFELQESGLIVPKDAEFIGAIGAAQIGSGPKKACHSEGVERPKNLTQNDDGALSPLFTQNVRFLRDRVKPYQFKETGKVNVFLGIDIGSVSTNFVVLDESGELIMEIYTYTKARPIEVVTDGLKEIESAIGDKVNICGVGTTGSGRELIGELIGADVIKDEITAHKTGAFHISQKLTGEKTCVDTIFEIGGQDAKYIRIENGIVTDFAMNEACAAGTGSFLEEQAARLGISIKNQFAGLALASKNPVSLGERCTVFMERDVNSHQLKNSKIEDIVAGLAYSVATNYLNRVVRGRKIGDHIFFQGGTAYNDAVAAAFSQILGKTITVPPHNGVIGAVGAALLARLGDDIRTTKFRGFDIGSVSYTMREFACGVCSNNCDIQEFNVEGEKTFWGDKCSSRFRKKARTSNKPVIEDLLKLRTQLLEGVPNQRTSVLTHQRTKIGLPRAMFYFDRFPFWRSYFESLGCEIVVSDPTNKNIAHDSLELTVSEPCYPIKLVHGHVKDLADKKVDYIFVPNVLTAPSPQPSSSRGEGEGGGGPISYLCPWHQTLPFVIRAVPAFESIKFIIPTVQFEFGAKFVTKCLSGAAKQLGCSKSKNREAVEKAYKSQRFFNERLAAEGKKALSILEASDAPAVVLLGRPYNIYDTGANLNVPVKLREYYGINVLPIDFLPVDDVDITDITDNMFWNYGRKIIAAARFVASRPNLHAIFITNFKCGPDSFIKHFATWAGDKPYLTLQFDEHANDAGTITRIEAYLDSKGLLKTDPICKSCKEEQYSSPKWTMAGQESSQRPSAQVE